MHGGDTRFCSGLFTFPCSPGCNRAKLSLATSFEMLFLARHLKFLPDRLICENRAELLNLLWVEIGHRLTRVQTHLPLDLNLLSI
jgi:hypothetical protein